MSGFLSGFLFYLPSISIIRQEFPPSKSDRTATAGKFSRRPPLSLFSQRNIRQSTTRRTAPDFDLRHAERKTIAFSGQSNRVHICTQSDPGSLRGRGFSEASFVLLRARTRRSFLALFLAALGFTLPRLFASRRSAARSTAGLGVGTLPSLPSTLHFTGSGTSSGSSARLLLISALASLPSTPCFTLSRTSR